MLLLSKCEKVSPCLTYVRLARFLRRRYLSDINVCNCGIKFLIFYVSVFFPVCGSVLVRDCAEISYRRNNILLRPWFCLFMSSSKSLFITTVVVKEFVYNKTDELLCIVAMIGFVMELSSELDVFRSV